MQDQTEQRYPGSGSIVFILIPNIVLCLSGGFLSTLIFRTFYYEIKSVESDWLFFQIFLAGTILSFLAGFFTGYILSKSKLRIIEVLSISWLIGVSCFVFFGEFDSIITEYIFHAIPVIALILSAAFIAGLTIATLHSIRLWSFLTGSLMFLFYINNDLQITINSISYVITFCLVTSGELFLHAFLKQFKFISDGRGKINKRFILNEYFYSGILLFTAHTIYLLLHPEKNPDMPGAGAMTGLLLFNIIYHNGSFRNQAKFRFILGELFVFSGILLFSRLSRFEQVSFFIFLIDSSLISYFRPEIINRRKLVIAILIGIVLAILPVLIRETAMNRNFYYLFILFSSILPWIFLLEVKQIRILHRAFLFFLSVVLAYYVFVPYEYVYTEVKKESSENHYPFQIVKIPFDENRFLYYKSSLPFHEERMLPGLQKLSGKIFVTSFSANETENALIRAYVRKIQKRGVQYIIFQETNGQKETEFPAMEFFSFRIYSNYSINSENTTKGRDWKEEYIHSKIKDEKSVNGIISRLKTVQQYSSGELYVAAKNSVEPYLDSLFAYAEFYYKEGNYRFTVNFLKEHLQYSPLNQKAIELSLNALKKKIPSTEDIPLFLDLLKRNAINLELMEIFLPILIAENNSADTDIVLNKLMDHYLKTENNKRVQELLAEKATLYIRNKELVKAEEIVKKELRSNSDSNLWLRLNEEILHQKNLMRNHWEQELRVRYRGNI